MAYEGLDVKPVTHICCLTHIRSTPWIEQMLARAWRASPGKTRSWAFIPDDPYMKRIIVRIKKEEPGKIAIPGEEGNGGGGVGIKDTVPLYSGIDKIRHEMLDIVAYRYEAAEILSKYGLSDDDPAIEPLANSLLLQKQKEIESTTTGVTLTEELRNYRNAIAKICRTADSTLPIDESTGKPPWGHHGRLLYKNIGVRLEDATLEELKNALKLIQDYVSR